MIKGVTHAHLGPIWYHLFYIIFQFIFIEISTGAASFDSNRVSSHSKIELINKSDVCGILVDSSQVVPTWVE